MNEILIEVFNLNNIPYDLDSIKRKSRKVELVMRKKIACIALVNAGYSHNRVGNFLGIDHATVNHHIHHSVWHPDFKLTKFPEYSKARIVSKINYHKEQIRLLESQLDQAS